MGDSEYDPFFGEQPAEIPLASAPLAGVIAQVQFARILKLRSEDYIAPFQERIRSHYPKMKREAVQVIAAAGINEDAASEIIWRFMGEKDQWRVTLTPTFIALESRAYTSRTDFMERFKSILAALEVTVGTAQVTRVGVRYVDHIKSPEIDSMSEMLRPEMLGITGTALVDRIQHSVSEMLCEVAEGSLLARWGLLPPNGTHDINMMPPAPTKSWFLDLDVFKQYQEPIQSLDVDVIHSTAFALAARCYTVFRWMTTERFLVVYGGE